MPFITGDVVISHTDSYCYLGALISANSVSRQIQDHAKMKSGHVRKFQSFVYRNRNAPFCVKKTMLQSAVASSLLYSCETWCTENLKSIESGVLQCIKCLLGIRQQTMSDLVYIEGDIAPVSTTVKKRQCSFLQKLFSSENFTSSPVRKAFNLAIQLRTPMGRYMEKLTGTQDHEMLSDGNLRKLVQASTSTRAVTYKTINH